MFTRLPANGSAPDRTTFPTYRAQDSKCVLFNWLSHFSLGTIRRPSHASRTLLLPALAASLIVSTTLTGCGGEETASPPPAVGQSTQTANRTNPGSSVNDGRNADANASIPANVQELAKVENPEPSVASKPTETIASATAGPTTAPAATEQRQQPRGERARTATGRNRSTLKPRSTC